MKKKGKSKKDKKNIRIYDRGEKRKEKLL